MTEPTLEPSAHDSSHGSGEVAQYDEFAAVYAHENEHGFFNAWYERPEMLRLAGEVAGLRVLDAGCGSGPLAQALRDRGAAVSAFDVSPAMVSLARERLGPGSDVRVADLNTTLPYPDGVFDLVTASLMIHYLADWTRPLAELRRVLAPGGRLLVSTLHPFVYAAQYRDRDYFTPTKYSEDYQFGDHSVTMTYWHRPLQDVLTAFGDAGFRISRVTEPDAHPDTPAELHPAPERRRFLGFLFLELVAPDRS